LYDNEDDGIWQGKITDDGRKVDERGFGVFRKA
jgi:hypothetical protein